MAKSLRNVSLQQRGHNLRAVALLALLLNALREIRGKTMLTSRMTPLFCLLCSVFLDVDVVIFRRRINKRK